MSVSIFPCKYGLSSLAFLGYKPRVTREPKKKRLAIALAIVFAVAVIMGPGPGILLVNPDPDETTARTVLGMPIIYAWTAFWFGVQAVVVLLSYRFLWRSSSQRKSKDAVTWKSMTCSRIQSLRSHRSRYS